MTKAYSEIMEALYLDVALMPDGSILVLDEDELINAFNNGIVSQQDYDTAQGTVKKLIDEKIIDVSNMEALCSRLQLLFAESFGKV
ncbi:MAG: hypothetical protein FWC32_11245 [Firmicutes bacterium]|nr:hypothetical protein [Bacillota bacterium]